MLSWMKKKKKKEERPVLIRLLDSIYEELETIHKQIGELLIALHNNGCLTAEQAKEILYAEKKEEQKE